MAGSATLSRFFLLLGSVVGLVSAQSPVGKALVIGNGAYKNIPAVPTAGSDAREIARQLRAMGLEVTLVQDTEVADLAKAVDSFLKTLTAEAPGVFYYAGYAVQNQGENYLLPIGYEIGGTEPVEYSAYSLKRIERFLEGKRPRPGVMILETAPLPTSLSRYFGEAGLALMDVRSPDMLLSFASLPGQSAKAPGARPVSYFTQAWGEAFEKPWESVDAMSRRVKQRVAELTAGAQVPAEMSTLVTTFAFRPRPPQELEWEQLAKSRDLGALRAFAARYPADPLAKLATARVEELEWAQTQEQGSRAALRQFLERYPGHPGARQALEAAEAAEAAASTQSVLAVIARYGKAFSEKNLEGLKATRPSLTAEELRKMEQSFRMAKSLQMTLTPKQAPVVTGAAVSVPCEMQVEMRMDRSSPPPVKQQVVITLVRTGSDWVIETIR
jgi:hypothetical protein